MGDAELPTSDTLTCGCRQFVRVHAYSVRKKVDSGSPPAHPTIGRVGPPGCAVCLCCVSVLCVCAVCLCCVCLYGHLVLLVFVSVLWAKKS